MLTVMAGLAAFALCDTLVGGGKNTPKALPDGAKVVAVKGTKIIWRRV